ncbi:MAG: ankyrin repeat domain-containing protein [Spirochaetia bacterium]|nr:ankyrin repeat domain-containing protein [Spirochaetia bacterium]
MRFLPAFFFSFLFVCPTFAATVSVTDANFETLSRDKPLLAFLSLGCDVGSYASKMFENANRDVQGVQLGVIDYNSVRTIHSKIYALYQEKNIQVGKEGVTLGTVLLIKDGKLLATSQMGYPGRAPSAYDGGVADLRRWLIYALKSNGIDVRLTFRPPEQDFVAPSDVSSQVDLARGRTSFFTFDNLKDSTATQQDFRLAGTAKLESGSVYLNGKYDGKSTAWFSYKSKEEEPYKNGLAFSFNFRRLSPDQGRGHLATLGYGLVDLKIWQGTLLLSIDPTYASGEDGSLGSWEYKLEDAAFRVNTWHNIIVSIDPAAKRARVLFDGKRLRDIVLDDRMLKVLPNYKAGSSLHGSPLGFEFSQFAGGSVMHGYGDNVVTYNRPLNGAEMLALAKDLRNPNQPVVQPAQNPNQSKLDMNLLAAAKIGDADAIAAALSSGANIDFVYQGWAAIHFAAYYGHEDAIKKLIESHANVLLKAQDHFTAQDLAKIKGNDSIVELLNDASNTERFYQFRSFPLTQHRAIPAAPELSKR